MTQAVIPDRLAGSVPVSMSTRLRVEEAAVRLRAAIDRDKRVETGSRSDRRLDGAVLDDRSIDVRVFEVSGQLCRTTACRARVLAAIGLVATAFALFGKGEHLPGLLPKPSVLRPSPTPAWRPS